MPPRTTVAAALIAILPVLFSSGCTREPAAGQMEADRVFHDAGMALARADYRQALQLLYRVLPLESGLSRPARVGEVLRLLGDIHVSLAAADSGIYWYRRASDQYRSIGERTTARTLGLEVVRLRRAMGEERQAFEEYTEMLRLARAFNDQEAIQAVLWAMLPAARAVDDAEAESRIATELVKLAGRDAAQQARIAFELGISRAEKRQTDRAAEQFLRAFTLADRGRDSAFALAALTRLGMATAAAGRDNDALQVFGDALRRAEPLQRSQALRLELLIRVGNIYLRVRQFDDARRFFRAALALAGAVGNRLLEGFVLAQLGNSDAERSPEDAAENITAALQLFRQYGHGPGVAFADVGLARIAHRAGRITDAVQALTEAADLTEAAASARPDDDVTADCERALSGARLSAAHDALIDVLLQTGKPEAAFEMLERKNALALRRSLCLSEPDVADAQLAQALRRALALRGLCAAAERRVAEVMALSPRETALARKVKERLEHLGRDYAAAADEAARRDRAFEPLLRTGGLPAATIQKLLPAGTALVAFTPAERAFYAFVVTPGGLSVRMAAHERPRVLALSGECAALLAAHALGADTARIVRRSADPRLLDLLRQLAEVYLRPLAPDLPGLARAVVVPMAEEPWVPVHALRTGPATTAPPLIERCLVSYAPTAASLLLRPAVPGPVKDVLALGHPGKTTWDVEYDLRDIRAFYREARMLFGARATLDTLRAQRADLLHIAAEVRCNPLVPGNSYLILDDPRAPGVPERIPLEGLLSLPTFPVTVLSSLATDRAPLTTAVPYAFLANGGSTVIVNGFPVSRKAKKFFSEVFYTALAGGETAAGALRGTQIAMQRNPEFASPHVWATLFLWGR